MTRSAANFATLFLGIFATSFGERGSNIIGCTVDVAKQIRKIWPWSGDNLTNRAGINRAGIKRLHGLIMPSYGEYALYSGENTHTISNIIPAVHALYIAKQKAYRPRPIRPLVKFYVLSFECMREYLELE